MMRYIILLSGVLSSILTILVFANAKTKIQKHFGYLTLMITIWVFTNWVYFGIPRYPYVHFSYAFGCYLIMGIALWVTSYIRVQLSRSIRLLLIFSTILLSIISLIPNLLLGNEMMIGPFGYTAIEGPAFMYYALWAIAVLGSVLFLFVKTLRSSVGIKRVQLTYVALGFVVPISIVLVIDFILPLFGVLWLAGLDSPTAILFVSFIAYAILRYRFFDIRAVIRKSLVQFSTFVLLFAIYAYALLLVQRFTSSTFTLSSNTSLLVTIFIIGLTIEPLRKGIYKFIDGIVANREKDRQDALKRMQLMAASTMQFQTLVERMQQELGKTFSISVDFLLAERRVQALTQFPSGQLKVQLEDSVGLRLASGKVLICDELPYRIENGEAMLAPLHTWLQSNTISAVLPIGNREDFVGAFMFHDGQGSLPFTTDRVEFLKRFRNQVQFAFASAYAYKLAVERIGMKQ